VKDASWPRNEVDRFILAKLEHAGRAPTPDASREILARRLYFDLLGLPPSEAELAEFVPDPAADASEKRVDRL
jgi:hypothetical protein